MRGCFIIFEGCDRAGKTTQSTKLLDKLSTSKSMVELIRFPNRSSMITGTTIDKYLKNEIELNDNASHLLFSANRWELKDYIEERLNNGVNIICDRYVYSGICYSIAKNINKEWCVNTDIGLIKPDIIFFMNIDISSSSKRDGFGEEKYDTTDFQMKVYNQFKLLLFSNTVENNVHIINSEKSIDDIHNEIIDIMELYNNGNAIPYYSTNEKIKYIQKF